MIRDDTGRREDHVDVTAMHVDQRLRCAAVVHGGELHLRHALEHLHVEMRGRAEPRRPVSQLAGLFARQLDELADIAGRHLRADDQHLLELHQRRDRDEVARRVIGQLLVELGFITNVPSDVTISV